MIHYRGSVKICWIVYFYMTICAGVSQISLNGREEPAFADFISPRLIRFGMEIKVEGNI